MVNRLGNWLEPVAGMLTWLTRKLRYRAAMLVAAVYALCVIAPPLALAFTDGSTAAHCLTSDHGVAHAHVADAAPLKAHVHADGTSHQHPDDSASQKHADDDGTASPTTCCGLFCLVALAADSAMTASAPIHSAPISAFAADGLSGRGPDRINRPPISPLSP